MDDPTLVHVLNLGQQGGGDVEHTSFYYKDGLLYPQWHLPKVREGDVLACEQLVLP